MSEQKLTEAKKAVKERVYSREVQGCLPVDGATLAAHTALFNAIEPHWASRAVWSLIDDEGYLTHDEVTREVDRRGRLEALLKRSGRSR